MANQLLAPSIGSQVGCFGHPGLDPLIERVRHEALTVPTAYATGYGEYQSGGWDTLSLLNHSGDPRDVTIGDVDPVPTTLLREMPATAELIRTLGLQVWWARLALMKPGTFLWEHRDYTEPGVSGTERHRIHVPLVTSGSAFLITGGHAVHMGDGRIWRLNPVHVHGACNMAGPARLHLILDCHDSRELERLRSVEELPGEYIRALPEATPEELDRYVREAGRLTRLGFAQQAERHLLRVYFSHALPYAGWAYDMIADIYASQGDAESAAHWRARKTRTLGGA